MKEKITKKFIKNNFKNIIELGYCELNNLLSLKDANFYTCGVYGWNADIYILNWNTCIVTGYRPFGNILADRNIVKEYEQKALEIKKSNSTFEETEEKLNELINEFTKKIIK